MIRDVDFSYACWPFVLFGEMFIHDLWAFFFLSFFFLIFKFVFTDFESNLCLVFRG